MTATLTRILKCGFAFFIMMTIVMGTSVAGAEDKLLMGVYSLNADLWDDANVQMLENTGIDILIDVPSQPQLFDLCSAHNIQVIANDIFPGWWGGDGTNAGQYRDMISLPDIDAYADSVIEHTAVWGDYLVDEPNCEDFPWIVKVFERYSENFRQRQPFINLHPYYDDEMSTAMLGAPYHEYLLRYIDTIPVSYISFDSYPYSDPDVYGKTFLFGYDEVADVCRRNGREMWVTQQVGGYEAQDQMMEFQIRLQSNIALTYGAHGIIFASWSADWWDDATTCISNDGERNPSADYVERITREIRNIAPIYMTYGNLGVLPIGNLTIADDYLRPQLMQLQDDASGGAFDVCQQINADGAILCGCFMNTAGEKAVMLTNVNSLFDGSLDATVALPFQTNGWINGAEVRNTTEILLHPGDAAFLLIP